MSLTVHLRRLLILMLSLIVALTLVSCTKNKTTININSKKTNYNNIYNFAHSNFWVDKQTVYYSKSGFYNNIYYKLNNDGRQVITTDNKFKLTVADNSEGEIIGGIQAYQNNVFFWYAKETGERELYRYRESDKSFEKLICISENINDWAIVNDKVVYSTFSDEFDTGMNSLWFCELNGGTPQKIAHKTSAFGICGKKVRYIVSVNASESILYEFDLKNKKNRFLFSFNGLNDGYNLYNLYNFTEEHIVFVTNRLHIVEIKTGKQTNFELPGHVEFFNCYEKCIFLSCNNDIYKMNVFTGESELLCEMYNECNLLYAISDECAITVFYDSHAITTNIEVYAVYADGNSQKLFNI